MCISWNIKEIIEPSVYSLLNEQHVVQSPVAGINHSVACNITDQHTSLKVHNTVRNSELCNWETAVWKGNHPVEAVAGMGGVKWLRGDTKHWIHIYTLHDHDKAFHSLCYSSLL